MAQESAGTRVWCGYPLGDADDFVVLARHLGEPIERYLLDTLEGSLRLKVNREKSRIVQMRRKGASLSFLGYTFRYLRPP